MQDIDLAAVTDLELSQLVDLCIEEQSRRAKKAAAQEASQQAAEQFATAVQGEPAIIVADVDPAAAIGPGQHIVDADGVEWENATTAWLSPITAGPDAYPLGWKRAGKDAVDASTLAEWDPNGHAYAVGDRLSYHGVAYTVVQAHASQAGWTPDVVPALYTAA